MKEHILRLEPHDDIQSARDKLGWAQAQRVLLVWPPGSRVLDRQLDLVLLQRHAQALGAQLAIVSLHGPVRDHAQAIGLPVFDSIDASRQVRWGTPSSGNGRPLVLTTPALTALRAPLGPEAPSGLVAQRRPRSPEELARPVPLPGPIQLRLPAWLERLRPQGRGAAFAAGLAATGALLLILGPSATVHLYPFPQTISVTLPFVADVAAESADPGGVLPAREITIELEASGRVATTGTKDVPSTPASGEVVFTNLVAQAVVIPQGTGVRTTSGTSVRFLTTKAANLPAGRGQALRVPVVADALGPQGNVAAGQINAVEGQLGLQVAVVNDAPTSGGGVEQRAAVDEADQQALRAELLEELTRQAVADLSAQLREGERMPADSVRVVRVLAETYDRFPGEAADSLGLTLRVRAGGTAVDSALAEGLALEALASRVATGFTLIAGSQQVVWVSEPRAFGPDRLAFTLRVSGDAAPSIDSHAVQTLLSGLTMDAALERLSDSLPMRRPPVIEIRPSWFPRLPWLPFRIRVVAESEADA